VFQLYPVEEVLKRYDKGTVNGPRLVEKLQANNKMTRTERIFFVKVLGKYLMKEALRLVSWYINRASCYCIFCTHHVVEAGKW